MIRKIKLNLLLCVLMIPWSLAFGQVSLVKNHGFDNVKDRFSGSPHGNGLPSYYTKIYHWRDPQKVNQFCTIGTPDVLSDAWAISNGGNPALILSRSPNYKGHTWVFFDQNSFGEYLVGEITSSLVKSKTYLIEFYVAADRHYTDSSEFDYSLAGCGIRFCEGLPEQKCENDGLDLVDQSDKLPIVSINQNVGDLWIEWQRKSGYFTVDEENLDHIILGQFKGPMNPSTVGIYWEDIRLTEVCWPERLYENATFKHEDMIYYATNRIVAGNDVDPEIKNGDVVIASDSKVVFQAGNEVVMMAGFETEPGAQFTAQIGDCSSESCIPVYLPTQTIDVCGEEHVILTTESHSGWEYTWSNGELGPDLNSIEVNADNESNEYGVTITDPETGCFIIQNFQVNFHTVNNGPPIQNGIDGSGNYNVIAQAGSPVNFVVPSSDASGEKVIVSSNSPYVSGSNDNYQSAIFSWIPTDTDIGTQYCFTVTFTDNNACEPLSTEAQFCVTVICASCPLNVYYENKNPETNPVPVLTQAGNLIKAGYSVDPTQTDGNVIAGYEPTVFKANTIELVAGFSTECEFLATHDISACTENCNTCCEDFTGFTHDNIPAVFTPNNDGINDIWEVRDSQNPMCAYNAMGYVLNINDRWGKLIYTKNEYSLACCHFKSPVASNPAVQVASIHWDGVANNGVLSGSMVPDGEYFYTLVLIGCGQSLELSGDIALLAGSQRSDSTGYFGDEWKLDTRFETQTNGVESVEDLNNSIQLFPNPAQDQITIVSNSSTFTVTIYAMSGATVFQSESHSSEYNQDISFLNDGVYTCEIKTKDEVKQFQLIKRH